MKAPHDPMTQLILDARRLQKKRWSEATLAERTLYYLKRDDRTYDLGPCILTCLQTNHQLNTDKMQIEDMSKIETILTSSINVPYWQEVLKDAKLELLDEYNLETINKLNNKLQTHLKELNKILAKKTLIEKVAAAHNEQDVNSYKSKYNRLNQQSNRINDKKRNVAEFEKQRSDCKKEISEEFLRVWDFVLVSKKEIEQIRIQFNNRAILVKEVGDLEALKKLYDDLYEKTSSMQYIEPSMLQLPSGGQKIRIIHSSHDIGNEGKTQPDTQLDLKSKAQTLSLKNEKKQQPTPTTEIMPTPPTVTIPSQLLPEGVSVSPQIKEISQTPTSVPQVPLLNVINPPQPPLPPGNAPSVPQAPALNGAPPPPGIPTKNAVKKILVELKLLPGEPEKKAEETDTVEAKKTYIAAVRLSIQSTKDRMKALEQTKRQWEELKNLLPVKEGETPALKKELAYFLEKKEKVVDYLMGKTTIIYCDDDLYDSLQKESVRMTHTIAKKTDRIKELEAELKALSSTIEEIKNAIPKLAKAISAEEQEFSSYCGTSRYDENKLIKLFKEKEMGLEILEIGKEEIEKRNLLKKQKEEEDKKKTQEREESTKKLGEHYASLFGKYNSKYNTEFGKKFVVQLDDRAVAIMDKNKLREERKKYETPILK